VLAVLASTLFRRARGPGPVPVPPPRIVTGKVVVARLSGQRSAGTLPGPWIMGHDGGRARSLEGLLVPIRGFVRVPGVAGLAWFAPP